MTIVTQLPHSTQIDLEFVVVEDPFESILEAIDEFECTCRPNDDLACRGCKAYTRAKYGDGIPF